MTSSSLGSGPLILIRLDRLGDLLLTLPVQEEISSSLPVQWIIAHSFTRLVKEIYPHIHLGLSLSPKPQSFFNLCKNIHRLWSFLRKEKPRGVIIFQAPWWVSMTVFLARVPLRGGRYSQWHSYLFLNRGLRQRRSLSEKHELEYNIDLLKFILSERSLGTRANGPPQQMNRILQTHWSQVKVPPPESLLQSPPLLSSETSEDPSDPDLPNSPYLVIHPGMGGSALNWPPSHYNRLIEEILLRRPEITLIITGTSLDAPWVEPLKKQWGNHHRLRFALDQLSLVEMVRLLRGALALVAPSTGILHLGAQIPDLPLIGIYSPLRAHSVQRWGPWRKRPHKEEKKEETRIFTLTPSLSCPAPLHCLEARCPHYPCMDRILPEEVLKIILTL